MTSPTSTSTPPSTCPRCGAAAAGRFCSECGAPVVGAVCASCASALSPGARFCHRCGTAVGAMPGATPLAAARPGAGAGDGRPFASVLPWGIAAVALLTLVGLAAGRGFQRTGGSTLDAPLNALPVPGLDDRGMGAAPGGGPPRAPDISQLSPQQRASRLFDRVMSLAEQGKVDSVLFFAPMATTAYQMLGALNADQRYDLGRIGEVAGQVQLARAQADTILREQPTHLLGLVLAARAAELVGDTTGRREYERRLLAAEAAEGQKGLPEYDLHRTDIAAAVERARQGR